MADEDIQEELDLDIDLLDEDDFCEDCGEEECDCDADLEEDVE
jgi:hypothetical protein